MVLRTRVVSENLHRVDWGGRMAALGHLSVPGGRKCLAFVLQLRHNRSMKTSVVHARIEPQTKQKAEGVLRKLGLTPTEAIRIFYRQISLRGGLPFPVEIPNELTASTLAKSRRGEDIQEFESVDAMFKNWEK
jgi:DNA-damage-inducible protein J